MATTTATRTLAPNRPNGADIRGFALYVGISEDKISSENIRLSDLVRQIRELIAEIAPEADTHATVALAPEQAGGRDIDIVRLALNDPSLNQQKTQKPSADRVSHVTIDLTRKQVLLDSIPAPLTYREFELLQFLVLREGRTVSREDIVAGLWANSDEELPSARTIDVHVRRLRIKLSAYQDIVRTVRGAGYRFDRHADVQILTSGTPSPDRF